MLKRSAGFIARANVSGSFKLLRAGFVTVYRQLKPHLNCAVDRICVSGARDDHY